MVNSRDRWRSCENPTKVSATPEASLALLLPIVMRGLKAGRALVALLVGDGDVPWETSKVQRLRPEVKIISLNTDPKVPLIAEA